MRAAPYETVFWLWRTGTEVVTSVQSTKNLLEQLTGENESIAWKTELPEDFFGADRKCHNLDGPKKTDEKTMSAKKQQFQRTCITWRLHDSYPSRKCMQILHVACMCANKIFIKHGKFSHATYKILTKFWKKFPCSMENFVKIRKNFTKFCKNFGKFLLE